MRTYEYMTVHVPAAPRGRLVKTPNVWRFNALGADGWEAFDGYADAVMDGIHVLLRRSSLAVGS